VFSILPLLLILSVFIVPSNNSWSLFRTQQFQMKELDLNWNDFGDEGAEYIATALHKIKRLNLEGCKINVQGIKALSEASKLLTEPVSHISPPYYFFSRYNPSVFRHQRRQSFSVCKTGGILRVSCKSGNCE